MPFLVPASLIAQASPSFVPTRTPNAPPILIDSKTKAALCMKWLDSKLTASKSKAEQRVGAVFNDFPTTRSNARATVHAFHYEDMASLGRQYGVYIEQDTGNQTGNMSALLDVLQSQKSAALALLTSEAGFLYPVAAYRSGGKAGLNPHIYLFLPGIGELRPIKPKKFARLVDTAIELTDRNRIIGLNIMSARSYRTPDDNVYDEVAADQEEAVYDAVAEDEYETLGSRGYQGGAAVGGRVTEDRAAGYAALQHYEQVDF